MGNKKKRVNKKEKLRNKLRRKNIQFSGCVIEYLLSFLCEYLIFGLSIFHINLSVWKNISVYLVYDDSVNLLKIKFSKFYIRLLKTFQKKLNLTSICGRFLAELETKLNI